MNGQNVSTLTGYVLNTNLDGMTFDEVWDEFIDNKAEGVRCSEVLHFDLTPKDLAKMLRKGELREVIDEMRAAGASFVFVGPVVGKPIDGLSI